MGCRLWKSVLLLLLWEGKRCGFMRKLSVFWGSGNQQHHTISQYDFSFVFLFVLTFCSPGFMRIIVVGMFYWLLLCVSARFGDVDDDNEGKHPL